MEMTPKSRGILILLGLTIAFFAGKYFWYDRRDVKAQELANVGGVALPTDAASTQSGDIGPKVSIPSSEPVSKGGTPCTWWQMAWLAQTGANFANGGKQTTSGSLVESSGLEITIERMADDDCNKMLDQVAKFCEAYKKDPSTPGVWASFMGDGMPGYFAALQNVTKPLGPEYQPVGFMSVGKSFGEDKVMGSPEVLADKSKARGQVLACVLRDGDMNIALKWAGDNGIPVNPDETTYDPNALNLMAASNFLDAAAKYINGYQEPRKLIVNGMKTYRDTSVSATMVATWTPGDVNVAEQKGGLVTIASTKEYSSQMPNITITCRKWLRDHQDQVVKAIIAFSKGGEQVNAYPDIRLHACKINAEIWNEQNAGYWAKYYKGVKTQDLQNLDVDLGGSLAFNLADQANMLGLGSDKIDRYKIVYTKFGDILKKMYPQFLSNYPPYNEVMDKTYLIQALATSSDPVEETEIQYADAMTDVMATKSYGDGTKETIKFSFGKADIDPISIAALDDIVSTAMIAETQKVRIEGHTDNIGDQRANLILSERRAQSVAEYLTSKGIKPSRIEVKGYGEEQPIASNATKDGQAANRRVQIILGH